MGRRRRQMKRKGTDIAEKKERMKKEKVLRMSGKRLGTANETSEREQ
jgi:hypothetical protein